MLKNYLKITWRNLTRNKVSSCINIGGLAIGLACVILIGMYIKDELNYDRFFSDSGRIYRVNTHEKVGNEEFIAGHTAPPAGHALLDQFPEIDSYTRIFRPGDEIVHYTVNGKKNSLTEKDILSVDSNFLQFFDYPLVEGDRNNCLNGPNSIVLTETAAKKYFGTSSAIGKNLALDEYATPFTVTAVLKDLAAHSSLQFELLQSNTGMPPVKHFSWSWIWLQMGTYVKLKGGLPHDAAAIRRIEAKFPPMIRTQAAGAFARVGQPLDEFLKKGNRYDLSLQPLREIHLYSGGIVSRYFSQGDIKYVYIFSAIALFIMLLACVNFMNLATAQSAKRAREVGIRKVLGSERGQLIGQFLGEAFLYTLAAAGIAVLIAASVLPAFNRLSGKSLDFAAFFDIMTLAALAVLVLVTALLAGSYPAFFLTSFHPVSVLKGGGDTKHSTRGFFTRNVLVVFQFTVATVLINCTIIVYKQLLFEQSKDLGFNKENVLVISNADRLGNSEEPFRQELLRLPQVAGATISTGLPAMEHFFEDAYIPETADNDVAAAERHEYLTSFMVDDSFLPTLDLKMASGRNFSRDFSDSSSVILNEAAVRQMGWKDAIGKHLVYPGGNYTKFTVVGVVKDFHNESLHSKISPFALFYVTSHSYFSRVSYIAVRIKGGDYGRTIAGIRNKWAAFVPDNPFESSFLDEQYDSLYRTDQGIAKVFSVFTLLSVTVACLGLLGLAMYTAERRTKEIGIRKVLGASIQNVVGMLSKEFLKLVLLATAIGLPIAWYTMHKWLEDFAYPTTLHWWIFGLTAGVVTLIALGTVSFQAVKAALLNPVESLKNE